MQKQRVYHPKTDHSVLLEVRIEDCNSIEQMIKRFLKKFKKFRLMDEIKSHESYMKPSMEKHLAEKESRRKQRKIQREFEEKTKDK
jgi:ribosomal protein S21